MNDLISRQAAIDAICKHGTALERKGILVLALVEHKSMTIDLLESLPSADVVEIKKDGEWEMFDLISSAYYGKGMYFKQDDGTVYSRYSCKHMSVDEAIREFVSLVDDSDLPDVKAHWEDEWNIVFHAYLPRCSSCGNYSPLRYKFCPNCGARMEADDAET